MNKDMIQATVLIAVFTLGFFYGTKYGVVIAITGAVG